MKSYDCVIIGAGPAGLTAALYLCHFGVRAALVEQLAPGGQLIKTAQIGNYPGFPKGVEGWTLAETFAAHLEPFHLDRFTREVRAVERRGAGYRLTLDAEEIEGRSLIVCSGASPRKLGLEAEQRLTGHGVSYCAMCDGMFFRDQVVAMVGGGNAALEEALYLARLVKKLYLVHRRDAFRADRIYQDKLAAFGDRIEPVLNHVVRELHGDKTLTGVTLASTLDGTTTRLDVGGLFVFIGSEPRATFLIPGLRTDAAGFIVTDTEMRTNIPGVFAAGDIRSKACRQVVTAVGDGATAAHSVFAYLEQLEVAP